MIPFLFAAVAMTLAAVALVVVPLFREESSPAPVAAVMTALAIPVAVMLLYASLSSYPWVAGSGAGAGARPAAADTAEISALKRQLARTPDDAEGWVSLGNSYVAAERFAEARDAYQQAMKTGASSDEVRLAYAEASILDDRNALAGEAGRIVEDVLSRHPDSPKVLWYGGMAALARGDAAAARARWGKLLELSPPPAVRHVIEEQLAAAGASPPQGVGRQEAPAAAGATKIAVHVTVEPGLASRIRPGATLFLFARAPGGAGPPLAVVRRERPTLPIDLEISDADSMVPGRTMAGLPEVQLTARMANDGQALATAGDVFGEALWKGEASPAGPVHIRLDHVVQ